MAGSKRVVIVGAGAAGLSAAARLKERGVLPLLLSRGIGASSMTSGGADLTPWTHPRPLRPSEAALSFVHSLGVFGQEGLVASAEGVLRQAAAVGARVLNVGKFAGKRIGVADLPRTDFDPARLAFQLSQSDWATSTQTHFEVVPLPGVVSEQERKFPLAAFQRLFDEEERLTRMRECAQALSSTVQALLVGPWLGEGKSPIEAGGIAVGEVLSPPEGAFGRRFEKARGEFCAKFGLDLRAEWVQQITEEEELLRLLTDGGTEENRGTLFADSVILATGGLIGHGVALLERAGEPKSLGTLLDPKVSLLGGALEGWDASSDGGGWVTPPHQRIAPHLTSKARLLFAGDVRRQVSSSAPGGTFFGAVQSGLDAADAILGTGGAPFSRSSDDR